MLEDPVAEHKVGLRQRQLIENRYHSNLTPDGTTSGYASHYAKFKLEKHSFLRRDLQEANDSSSYVGTFFFLLLPFLILCLMWYGDVDGGY
jgi:hypothetical protein